MNRRVLFLSLVAIGLAMAICGVHGAEVKRPNVVLIMADDLGYGDLSCHGNPILKTPEIDALAAQSIRLDDYHTSPYCVPTRASLMTGRYADKTGVHNLAAAHWFIRRDQTLISSLFKNAGYATGMFGKWHLGDNEPYGPESRDFDEVVRHYGGAIGTIADYWNNAYVDDTYYHNGKPEKFEGYLNYHDCIGRKGGWFQNHMRQPELDPLVGDVGDAYWPIDVRRSGKYCIELRRWPKEVDAAIHAGLPAGDPVYGKKKSRGVPGVGFKATRATLLVGGKSYEADVTPSDKALAFEVSLERGSTKLSAFFSNVPGKKSLDAFYVFVSPAGKPQAGTSSGKPHIGPTAILQEK